MDTVSFIARPSKPLDRAGGIRIAINGRDLAEIVREHELPFALREGQPEIAGAYAGLPAGPHTVPPSKHFLGEPSWELYRDDGKVYVLDCECGAPGCWPLVCRIEVGESGVVWRDFEQVHRRLGHPTGAWTYEGLGPFRFDQRQFIAALEGLRIMGTG